jgi:hypothetical protein
MQNCAQLQPIGPQPCGMPHLTLLLAHNLLCTPGNNATKTGGAINLQSSLCDGERVRLSRVRFEDNTAGSNGGGLCLLDSSAMEVNITDSAFINNHVRKPPWRCPAVQLSSKFVCARAPACLQHDACCHNSMPPPGCAVWASQG